MKILIPKLLIDFLDIDRFAPILPPPRFLSTGSWNGCNDTALQVIVDLQGNGDVILNIVCIN
ncbi:MAG: hypothetical protein OXE84_15025 [Rhodobacteraceae bacterium]|nr:hypothetical protein [Paracoccaceae bacterium]MCY4196955.1 hypothetical protein [Paracoccaceae bacterium]MCY4326782.1 hypothetical protein [Paracoccaceae bacterium]